MTSDFVSSLGDCLLAGSLDVVHHHHILNLVATPVHVKYLSVLLYLSSYLIVVKVGRGKAYTSSTGSPSSHLRWWTPHRTLVWILCFLPKVGAYVGA